jgi:hypothetical protein
MFLSKMQYATFEQAAAYIKALDLSLNLYFSQNISTTQTFSFVSDPRREKYKEKLFHFFFVRYFRANISQMLKVHSRRKLRKV